jgi:hypothetical protein
MPSTKPSPPGEGVIQVGQAFIRGKKAVTLATPIDSGKAPKSGSSLAESPKKAQRDGSSASP